MLTKIIACVFLFFILSATSFGQQQTVATFAIKTSPPDSKAALTKKQSSTTSVTKVTADTSKTETADTTKPVTDTTKPATGSKPDIDDGDSDSSGQGTPSSGNCPKIEKISLMTESRQNDGSFLFSITDKSGNTLASFTIKEMDPVLFRKKTAEAVYGLCDAALSKADSNRADAVIADIGKEDLYMRFLKASLETDNSQDEAGTLYIHKYITMYSDTLWKDISQFGKDSITGAFKKRLTSLSPHTARLQAQLYAPLAYTESTDRRHYLYSYFADEDDGNDDPVNSAGKIRLSGRTNIPTPRGMFTLYRIQIQFQDGFIENITVEGKRDGDNHRLKFENIYPIPFSTKNNYKKLFETRIFEKTILRDSNYCLHVGDLMSYTQNLALESKDYSPANIVYDNAALADSVTTVTLYKEQTSKILEAKAYSDLKGVNSGNPNGLIQIEMSKKLNFWSQRLAFFGSKNINYGFFNYILPTLSINKIENNEKRLVLNYIGTATPKSNPDIPLTYASTIDIFSHQNFTVGFDMSAALIDDQAIKSTFNFGPFFYYGNVPVQDTLRQKVLNDDGTLKGFAPIQANNVNNYDINTFYWGAFAHWQIFPNPRYGVVIMGRIIDFKAITRKFLQVKDSVSYTSFISSQNGNADNYANYSYHKTLVGAEIYAFFRPSENNKLFFRYRYTKDLNDAKNPFRQIQVGYSFFLTKTKETKNAGSQTAPSKN